MTRLKLKDFFSLCNAASGLTAISMCFARHSLAWVFILLAWFFDWLDGVFARKTASDDFGVQIDALSDMVSFGVAPVVLALSKSDSTAAIAVFVAGVFYACCAAVRLALFNVQKDKKIFFGLPSPGAAFLSVLVFLFAPSQMPLALIVLGILMVSKFKLKKRLLY
jgi:CDP-diacylglycerol--serine O-phosphatidyltransferase